MERNLTDDSQMIRRHNPADHDARTTMYELMRTAPIPPEELLNNLPLFQDRRLLSRILWAAELYQKILPVHGNVLEFGVRYGPNLALFAALRGIFEPLNPNRKIIGFDTFAGFPSVTPSMDTEMYKPGDYAVPENYEAFLGQVLANHEAMGPLESIRRFELVKGDASVTVAEYLKGHPETLISLAYFDMDIYEPTKAVLQAIIPYLNKGAIIAFDEVNLPDFPGETVAFRECLGGKFKLIHSPFRGASAYLIYE
jgi:hypothetical protein